MRYTKLLNIGDRVWQPDPDDGRYIEGTVVSIQHGGGDPTWYAIEWDDGIESVDETDETVRKVK